MNRKTKSHTVDNKSGNVGRFFVQSLEIHSDASPYGFQNLRSSSFSNLQFDSGICLIFSRSGSMLDSGAKKNSLMNVVEWKLFSSETKMFQINFKIVRWQIYYLNAIHFELFDEQFSFNLHVLFCYFWFIHSKFSLFETIDCFLILLPINSNYLISSEYIYCSQLL